MPVGTMMIIECPNCGARSEITGVSSEAVVECRCAKELAVAKRPVSFPQTATGTNAMCSGCGRIYDPSTFRPGSEILCTCGNTIMISLSRLGGKDGRRKDDHQRVLQQEELHALIDVCKLMNAAVDTDTLLRTIIKLTSSMLQTDGASLLLRSEQSDELIFHVVSGDRASNLQHMRIDGTRGVVGWVVSTGEPALVNDAASDERFNSRVDRATSYTTQTILCVPLRVNNKVIGALEAVNKKIGDGFTQRDLALMEAIASQAAEAIHRAQLVEKNTRSQRLSAIGETVAELSHCIRNILNGLKGGAYMVNSGLESDNREALECGWKMVERNIGRVSDLALDMLDYSKDRTPVMKQNDANSMLDEIAAAMEGKAEASGVSLAVESDEDVAPFYFDERALHRCVMNLVSNAIDACGEGGGRVKLCSAVQDAKWIHLSVEDDGCGMSRDIQNKLFTSFFSTKGSRGTGLGLPVTRKILAEHGGDLLVKSEEGKGSVFTCRLPFRRERPAPSKT